LTKELAHLRQRLNDKDTAALLEWLAAGKKARDEWVANRYRKKVLPP
jgi:hypothetical protein